MKHKVNRKRANLVTPVAISVIACALAACGNAPASTETASDPDSSTDLAERVVQIESGLVSGVGGLDSTISVFRGIPYAAPPVGDLRWEPPAPVAPWTGVLKADSFGDVCPQLGTFPDDVNMSEDCLTVNVWTPDTTPDEKLPVYVWIYGGGFMQGTGSDPNFDGEGLAKKGIVVVTFNYRLGPLGFLATPELSAASGHNASGNYGLLDDIALLKWVQTNIPAFGGDPGKVTIGGQSAGAGTVGFLAMSPLADGLFRAGVAESQVRYPRDPELRYLNTSTRTLEAAEKAGEEYMDLVGAQSAEDLRAMPWEDLLKGVSEPDTSVDTGTLSLPPKFRPAVDGWIVPHTYDRTLADGLQNHVGYVAGNNKDESGAVPETAFDHIRSSDRTLRPGMPQTVVTLDEYKAWADRKFGNMADEFFSLYPASTDDEAARAHNDAARDNSRTSTYLWATEWKKTVDEPVYTYFWSHALVGPSEKTRGAFHGSEINYMFNNLYARDLPWTDVDREIADTMSSYLANIVASGDPNGEGLPEWPAFDPNTPMVMEVGDSFGPIPVAAPEKLDFWKRYFATQEPW